MNLMDSSKSFMKAIEISTIASFLLQFHIALLVGHLALSFQNLQIILNMTMINIQCPSNVIYFMQLIKKIVNVEILDPEFTTEVWFDF
jgi:hypothetical protein